VKDFILLRSNSQENFEEYNTMISWWSRHDDGHPLSTFDEYLNAMSKKYRNRAKNIVKKGTGDRAKKISHMMTSLPIQNAFYCSIIMSI